MKSGHSRSRDLTAIRAERRGKRLNPVRSIYPQYRLINTTAQSPNFPRDLVSVCRRLKNGGYPMDRQPRF